MRNLRLVGSVLGAVLLVTAASAAEPKVKTSSGTVIGTTQPGLQVFLGVPYAMPPVGDLRWRAPRPVTPWRGERAATRFAPSCMQGEAKPFGPYTPSFLIGPERSEDCLYLNVWAPSDGKGKRPVYFFIHGGAFQSGSGSIPAYDGAALARKGAVVVSINYRLGIFGFFAHPELTRESSLGSSGNYGLLDTVAALRWVQDNVARFGGDPGNVTIAGQSAGAIAVSDLLVSPLAKGLFHRAVIESGPVMGLPMPKLQEAERAGVTVATKLEAETIAELRDFQTADLAKAPLTAFPWPNVDGKVILADPEAQHTELLSDVPMIVGYTRDEHAATPKTSAAFEAEVRQRYGSFADRVLALYPHESDAEAARSSAQLTRDRYIAAMLLWAERHSNEKTPVYAYMFEHVFPGADPANFGAFHTSEVPYIFGALNLQDADYTDADRRISDEMQSRWLAFMRTGDPNPANAPTAWPRGSGDPSTVWRIDPADSAPLIEPARLALLREFSQQGGRLGLF